MATLGSIASIVVSLVGLGLLVYSATIYTAADTERWSWFFGGGIGFTIGGVAGMLTCWNHLRTVRGKRSELQGMAISTS